MDEHRFFITWIDSCCEVDPIRSALLEIMQSGDESEPCTSPSTGETCRLQVWFDAASALPASDREAWLARTIGEDTARAAVRRLLAADDEASFLDTPIAEHFAKLAATEIQPDGLIGQYVGEFRLVRALGRGGMAAVFLGERTGRDFSQYAAVKLLQRGLYSELEQRLFLRERRVLAALEHPNIARLIDGGVTQAGIAYLVMEFVDGVPITEYVRAHDLDVPQRLRLFLDVCRAVEAAHRSLIVHRDIKPSNILATETGNVKLLDFGIAKLLEEDAENATVTVGVFTPEYAAPEQMQGGAITTATDVYGLGVLLQELLLGIKPEVNAVNRSRRPSSHAEKRKDSASNVRGTPIAPKYTKEQFRRLLRGDLDNIILKALETEPEQRYASAGALADDIERHLDGRPVRAHPPSGWYRTRKFIQRHRGSVVTATILIAAVFVALGLALWEADVARREASRANTVRDFVERIFDPLDSGTPESKQLPLRELLKNGVERLDQLSELGPAERVDLLLMFSRLDEKVGEYGTAQSLADRATAIAERELGADHPLTLSALIARGLRTLHHDDYVHAEPELKEAERRLLSAHAAGGQLAALYDGLAVLVNKQGDTERALSYDKAALAASLAAFGPESEKAASGYFNLGYGLQAVGRFDEAVEAFRHAHAIFQQRSSPDSFDFANSLSGLGAAEFEAGRLHEAREHLIHANAIFTKLGGKPSRTQATNLGGWLCLTELTIAANSAIDSCGNGALLIEQIFGTTSPRFGLDLRFSAMLAIERGDLAQAQVLLDRSARLLVAPENIGWLGRTEITQGELYLLEGRPDLAGDSLTSGIAHFGNGHPPYLRRNGLALLALACSTIQSSSCATNLFEQADTELAKVEYRWNPTLLQAQIALAQIEIRRGRARAASERLRTAIEHAENEVDPTQPRLLAARLWLVVAEAANGDCDGARIRGKAVLETVRRNHLADHPLLATATRELSDSRACDSPPR